MQVKNCKETVYQKSFTEMTMGERLFYLRTQKGKTQDDLVGILGLASTEGYAKYERGDYDNISSKHLMKLAQYYSVTTDFILTGRENMTQEPHRVNPAVRDFGYIYLHSSSKKQAFLKRLVDFVNAEYTD